ncbi:MAG: antitoxin [Deltaproteobacteria bacterium]|nr:antitoxin [Deltaproteobacteria bacterium]
MSKRLQVLLEPREYRSFQQLAREAGLSLGEWVRQTLRRFASTRSTKSAQEKIEHIRRFSQYQAPTGDIEQILAEITDDIR